MAAAGFLFKTAVLREYHSAVESHFVFVLAGT